MPFVERNAKLEKRILKENLKDPKIKREIMIFNNEFKLNMSVHKARKKSRLSLKEISKKSGLSVDSIKKIESSISKATLKNFIKYLYGLGYTLKISKASK